MACMQIFCNWNQLNSFEEVQFGEGYFFCIFMQSMLFIVEYNTKLGTIFESNPESEREREKIHLWWQIRKTRKNGAFSINSINSKSITHSYSCENWMLLRHTHTLMPILKQQKIQMHVHMHAHFGFITSNIASAKWADSRKTTTNKYII